MFMFKSYPRGKNGKHQNIYVFTALVGGANGPIFKQPFLRECRPFFFYHIRGKNGKHQKFSVQVM